jgi:hypothetical protein
MLKFFEFSSKLTNSWILLINFEFICCSQLFIAIERDLTDDFIYIPIDVDIVNDGSLGWLLSDVVGG